MRNLIEMTDEMARKEFGDYYIVSKSRMENLLRCFEGARTRIAELTAIIKNQQDEIAELSKSIITSTEPAREES